MEPQHGKSGGKRVRDEYKALAPLFDRMAALGDDDPARADLRDRLITGHLPLAVHIAQRYSGKGIAKEDLLQVASVGLIHAVDRFDPGRGSDFLSYAVPTMMGEVRRHFRDTTWPMRVPRRLQELRLAINQASADLAQELGRPATNADLAAHLGVTEAEIEEGMEARQAFRSVSLDEPAFQDADSGALCESIGEDDLALELVVNHEALLPLLQDLPPREQRILALRFYDEMTQAQIGEAVGISQMHVSRLLKETLEDLREHLLIAPR
jgi:RNA polymerase sigma-B factor